MCLLVPAQVKVLQYIRQMIVLAACSESRKPFDAAAIDRLVLVDSVIQEAVVDYASHSGNSFVEYPDSLGVYKAVRV